MIEKSIVKQIVEEWLQDKDYFLVDVSVSNDNRIIVEIDHAEGVWIEDCVELSRFIESKMDREKEDFELEVGSAGIGQPFKVYQQYVNHVGRDVEVMTLRGEKLSGVLTDVNPESFSIEYEQKVRHEGAKRSVWETFTRTFGYDEVKYTKYLISFK